MLNMFKTVPLSSSFVVATSNMGKRGGAGGGKGGPTPQKNKDGASPMVKDAMKKHKWVEQILAKFDEEIKVLHQLPDILQAKYGNDKMRREFAGQLDEAFPEVDGEEYVKKLSPGSHKARLYMFGWRTDMGQKGLQDNDDVRTLIALICLQGFKTNTDVHIGCEKIVAQEPANLDTAVPCTALPFKKHELGLNSIAYVKGWTRCTAAIYIASCILELDLLDEIKMAHAVLFESLRSISVMVGEYESNVQRIMSNRGTA